MTDRERLGLRGPVQRLVTEKRGPDGPRFQEDVFDREGRLITHSDRRPDGSEHHVDRRNDEAGERIVANRRVERHPDGSRTEIVDVSQVSTWGTKGLHHTAFGTFGATVARTVYDPRGAPIETVYEGSRHEEVSRVRYVCDERGNILEAVQHSGESSPLISMVKEAAVSRGVPVSAQEAALVDRGAEQFAASFRYDGAGRVVEQEARFAGGRIRHSVWTYNDFGDMLTSSVKHREAPARLTRFEYEYDEQTNWVRKVARYPDPTPPDEYLRTITYFDD